MIFQKINGAWQTDADIDISLTQDALGYVLRLRDGSIERYSTVGVLASTTTPQGLTTTITAGSSPGTTDVIGPFGHKLTYANGANNDIATITTSANEVIRYSYDGNKNLTQVTYPDNTAKIYHYGNNLFPTALTGISYATVNPDGSLSNVTRYATYGYDTTGKAISTEHAVTTNGASQEKFTLAYDSNTQTTVTDPIGTTEVMTFAVNLGTKNLVSKVNQSDSKSVAQVFDANNNLTCKKDEEGRVTLYTYNSSNQKLSMTEGLAIPAGGDCNTCLSNPASCNVGGTGRVTTYDYVSSTLDLPRFIRRPSVASGQTFETEVVYGDTTNPNLPTQILQRGFTPQGAPVSRSVGLVYNSAGQVTSINGPRTDVADLTTLSYYNCTTGGACGQLQSITNALGHVTTFNSYDANGRLLSMTDANGLVTGYTYDARGRVKTVTQTPASGSATLAQYSYTVWGDVNQINLPDGKILSYIYDAAHYLRSITDNLGNQVRYSYDLKGNRVSDYTYDPNGTLVRQIDLVYDARNHLASINTAGSLTQQVHDAVGNLIRETDPNNNPASLHTPDALNRLVQTFDRLGGTTAYVYDPNDRVKTVASPNGASTQYAYDDLGNLLSENSPDRNGTAYLYDAAGNLTGKTDARGVAVNYVYDALNRLTAIDYPGTAEDASFVYDTGSCGAGVGRLCRQTDGSGVTTYSYDAWGNVLSQSRTVGNVTTLFQYSYDPANRITTITYPDSSVISYTRDSVGRITGINRTQGSLTSAILSNRQYRADGLVTSQVLGNGLNETRQYDLQGRLWHQALGAVDSRDYANYDANGNLKTLTATGLNGAYGYDALDRLITESSNVTHNFTYDANGNRSNDSGIAYIYQTTSNRLNSIGGVSLSLDPAGNIVSDNQGRSFSYNNAGDLASASQNGSLKANYVYNAHHQRTQKILPNGATIHYHYRPDGNLLAETNGQGQLLQTYVFADNTPIAIINGDQDGDGIIDAQDNCITLANPNQRDTNGDGYGNACDGDFNNTGTTNTLDLNLFKAAYGSTVGSPSYNPDIDLNGDGRINTLDLNLFKGLYGKPPGPSGPNGQATLPIVSYLYTDHLGTPRLATDDSGRITWRNDGSAFGDTAPNEDVDGDGRRTIVNLRYLGQYYDQETGLYYNWHRYYSPKEGRYISADPIGVIPGVGNSPNVSRRITDIMQSVPLNTRLQRGLNHPYAYVRNNPLRWRDPSGLLEEFFDESEFAPGTCFGDGCTAYGVPVHTNQSFGQCMAVCMTTGPLGKFCSLLSFGMGAISDGAGGAASNAICRTFVVPICKDKCENQQCPPNDIMLN